MLGREFHAQRGTERDQHAWRLLLSAVRVLFTSEKVWLHLGQSPPLPESACERLTARRWCVAPGPPGTPADLQLALGGATGAGTSPEPR